MADQQITIDYTIAATRTEQQIDVHLVLTYDDAAKRTAVEIKHDAYVVTGATGTYTTTKDNVSTVHDIVGLKKKHYLGNDDNLVLPTGTNIVDRHGITFEYSDPLKGSSKRAEDHTKSVNIFYNPQKKAVQQYSSQKSRTVTFTNDEDAAKVKSAAAVVNDVTLCFVAGTMIRTARGDVAVEALAVGDLAVTASGALRPIRWLGQRTIDLRRHPRSAEVGPVRIAAHAFGPATPSRDLFLSPGHPVLVGADADHEDGCLVPIMCLVNGTTIERMSMASVTYWHVELDEHDILLADGLPAESYFELGERSFFEEETASALTDPDFVVPGIHGRCRPVAIDGAIVEAERDRLDAVFGTRLAGACAWPSTSATLDF